MPSPTATTDWKVTDSGLQPSDSGEQVKITHVTGSLLNGQTFDYIIITDRGDSFEETADLLTFLSGVTSQRTRIKQSQVAAITVLDRLIPKSLLDSHSTATPQAPATPAQQFLTASQLLARQKDISN